MKRRPRDSVRTAVEPVWMVEAGTQVIQSVPDLSAALLRVRGVAEASEFFEPQYELSVHDPRQVYGMAAAVDCLFGAIRAGKRILIYGDYDADGITSAAIQLDVLQHLGAQVSPWLPHRLEHGYGLNRTVLSGLLDSFDVLVCVDCGVGQLQEAAWLQAQGKKVIIVDHHDMSAGLPLAEAVLHPRHPRGSYPFGHLCGAGMSWKLAAALLQDPRSGAPAGAEKWLLDLVCLGTLADAVPLLGENRALVRFGLEVLRRSRRPGLRALMARLGEDVFIDEQVVAFRLVPLLNAAGRMAHPQPALEVLLAEEPQAAALAEELHQLNRQRRAVSQRVQLEAERLAEHSRAPVIFAANMAWPAGVVGLVAGRLSEKFGRPALVVGGGNGGQAVGSVRGNGINVLEVLAAASGHLVRYGGHVGAAGFTVAEEKLAALQAAVEDFQPAGRSGPAAQRADAVVGEGVLGWEALEILEQFAPFGEGNPQPALVLSRARLLECRGVGGRSEHLKVTVEVVDCEMDGIGFGLSTLAAERGVREGVVVDLLFALEANEWRGRRSLQLHLKDIALAGTVKFISE